MELYKVRWRFTKGRPVRTSHVLNAADYKNDNIVIFNSGDSRWSHIYCQKCFSLPTKIAVVPSETPGQGTCRIVEGLKQSKKVLLLLAITGQIVSVDRACKRD